MVGVVDAPLSKRLVLEERAQLPEDFDWRAYVNRYPDIYAAGVCSEVDAARHWLKFGAAEERWCTRASYPPKLAMMCPSVHSMFVRAWGDIVCWDDAGSTKILQPFSATTDYGRDVYLGPVFNRIRTALYADRMPFSDVCTRCVCLRTDVEHSSIHVDRKILETLQVEPSYLCNLDCPGCVRRAVRRFAPAHTLEPLRLEKILIDLVGCGVIVNRFSFQGHGEPLLHPDLPSLARLVKQHYPDAYLSVATNAHGNDTEQLLNCGIDEFVCAIDGIDQPSYEPYRVGGDFERAFAFMAELACRARTSGARVKVVWRYTLFTHNDQGEQLLSAQEMARDAGIDELVFVFTRNGPGSKRVVRASQVPLLEPGVPLSFRTHAPSAPDLERRLRSARHLLERGDKDKVAILLRSVSRNLGRFFEDRSLMCDSLVSVAEELEDLAIRLPKEEGEAIRADVAHLGQESK
jgi:wyosine [tRNA(Phe)-imidazoG37] synthetase (radical SAM superfamily)